MRPSLPDAAALAVAFDFTGYPVDFPILPTTKAGCTMVYGVGVNDAPYLTQPRVLGRLVRCPAYERWVSMLKRCYRPTGQHIAIYAGCSVAEEWHSFMSFRSWLVKHPGWQSLEMDKDLLRANNRVYGPATCLLVPKAVNSLFIRQSKRGDSTLPVGVHPHNTGYAARLRMFGRMAHLGTFPTPDEAASVYREAKFKHALSVAKHIDDPALSVVVAANAARTLIPAEWKVPTGDWL